MIPIAPGKFIECVDEKSGITYKFAYLTGDRQDEFMRLQDTDNEKTLAYVQKAASEVEKIKGKRWSKGEKQEAIKKRANELAGSTPSDSTDKLKYSRSLIDIFLVGWEGKGLPKFPDSKPSQYLLLGDVMKVSEMITDKVQELTGIDMEEAKN